MPRKFVWILQKYILQTATIKTGWSKLGKWHLEIRFHRPSACFQRPKVFLRRRNCCVITIGHGSIMMITTFSLLFTRDLPRLNWIATKSQP